MPKIMIVEDDATILEIVSGNLKKWNHEVIIPDSFESVFDTFIKNEPQLVLLDINLPAYDGFFWCNKIREVSKVPIIFISSRNTNMDMIMAMNMGGDDFVQKPFSIDVLVAKINAVLRRVYSYTGTSLNIIEHDGIVLDMKEDSIVYDGKKISLTKNEYKILYILMKNKGVIVSRDKIMRALWEDETFVDDNTLTVNITRLRKKLADIGKETFIETRKGQGYIIS